jgi:hypothetical protein
MYINHTINIEEAIDVDIDIDDFVTEHEEEVIKSLERLDLLPNKMQSEEILEHVKLARGKLTMLIRIMESSSE